MGELGNTLSRARRARGLTLEDAERDTHVSRRYLQALESEDFSSFPAPVYARGFLRTYSRYLGLNPDELVRIFPNGGLSVDISPLPQVARPPAQLMSVNWLVGGAIALFLLAAGFLFTRGGDDGSVPGTNASVSQTTPATTSGVQEVVPPIVTETGPTQGRPITIEAGKLPDFVGADLPSALAVLRDGQTTYVVIEVSSDIVPNGLVISQSPDPGSAPDEEVTLVVSRGAGP